MLTTHKPTKTRQAKTVAKTWERARKLAQHYNLTNNEARHLISQLPQQDKQNLKKLLEKQNPNKQDLDPIIKPQLHHTSHAQQATPTQVNKLQQTQQHKLTLDQAEELLTNLNPLLQKYGLQNIQKTVNILQQIQNL